LNRFANGGTGQVEEIYRSRRIQTSPQLDHDTDCWIPQADVSWREQGQERRQLLAGPSDRFKIIDEAEIYAVEMAMAWIDAELVDDLTP
jgi:hypothetical protein